MLPMRGGAGAGAGALAAIAADAVLGPFHANQLHAANSAIGHFRAGTVSHVILWADVQSGKTGTYNAVIRQMMLEGLIDRAYILCGSSETTLRRQAREDSRTYNDDYVAGGTLSVLFRQDFKRNRLLTDGGRVLLVVDESHMDQGNGMQLDTFLHKHGIRMSGTTEFLRERNLYILSVSATPYAEIAAVAHSFSYPKEVVRLLPGPGYYGPANYLADGRLHSTFDIRTRPDDFAALLRAPAHAGKYALVRINDVPTYNAVIALAHRHRIPLRVYNGRHQTIAITATEAAEINAKRGPSRRVQSLEDAPATTTLVLLKQRLRAGKVVPKQHIGFVWEDAVTPHTDALIQGLFGRMCGYAVPAVPPSIYLPSSSLEVHEDRVVKFSEIQRHCLGLAPTKEPLVIPKKGSYLTGCRSSKRPSSGRTQCPALRIPGFLDAADYEHGARTGPTIKRDLLRRLTADDCALVREHAPLTTEQRDELCELLARYAALGVTPAGNGLPDDDPAALPPVHIRHGYRSTNPDGTFTYHQAAQFTALTTAAAAGTIAEENIALGHPFNFWVIHDNYNLPGAVAGDVYIIFYTRAVSSLRTRPLTHRIPLPRPCAFTLHNQRVGDAAVASVTLTLTDAIRDLPDAFEGQMNTVLDLWRRAKDGDLLVPRIDTKITNYGGRMWFSRTAYGSTNWEGGRFAATLATLEARYRCRFTVEAGEVYPAVFCVESISWDE
jgi:hypothetical protein